MPPPARMPRASYLCNGDKRIQRTPCTLGSNPHDNLGPLPPRWWMSPRSRSACTSNLRKVASLSHCATLQPAATGSGTLGQWLRDAVGPTPYAHVDNVRVSACGLRRSNPGRVLSFTFAPWLA